MHDVDEEKEASVRQRVRRGLERVAFGDLRDAVRLLFCEEGPSPQALRRMDLFSVAELKRPKGGGMEIKFCDRIRAMQCLLELDEGEDEGDSLSRAIEAGARAMREEESL